MRTNSSYSGSEDEMRRQMSWAEQVDIAYPLDECEFRGHIDEGCGGEEVLVQKQLIAVTV